MQLPSFCVYVCMCVCVCNKIQTRNGHLRRRNSTNYPKLPLKDLTFLERLPGHTQVYVSVYTGHNALVTPRRIYVFCAIAAMIKHFTTIRQWQQQVFNDQ